MHSDAIKREEKNVGRHALVTSFDGHVFHELVEKLSSWYRLLRVIAYIRRDTLNLNKTRTHFFDGLKFEEIQKAKHSLLLFVQNTAFQDDIQHLRLHHQLPAKSKLLKYSPFIDNVGLLRVGGRIKQSTVSFNIKQPIILPKTNPISKLIITDIHESYLHAEQSQTFVFVRQQYWIMGSRNLIRRIVDCCKTCFMQNAASHPVARSQTQDVIMRVPLP